MTTDLMEMLNKAMMDEYVAVNKDKNPIANASLNKEQVEYVIGQYTIFPKNITSFLYSAREKARDARWRDVDVELTRNLGEELGTETDCVPHYDWLLGSVKADFDLDLSGTIPSLSTNAFVKIMTSAMAKSPSYVMGAIYACESSAVPELKIVRELVSPLPKNSQLEVFFARHIGDFEVGHENKLRSACEFYVTTKEQFEQGFREVMQSMDDWWNGMYLEISQSNLCS